MERQYNMKQVGLILGVHRDTIMYWEKENLIPPIRRHHKNNYRIFNEEEIWEIAKIRGIGAVDFEAVDRHREAIRKKRRNAKLKS